MRRRKPTGWPKYMVAKRLKGGGVAYYWSPPTWAKARGFSGAAEALGTDFGDAKRKCDDVLNPYFEEWRTGRPGERIDRVAHGTFDWMVAVYKSSPRYTALPLRTRRSYDCVLRLVSEYKLKDGRSFGSVSLRSVTPGAADRLFAKDTRQINRSD